jgi:hypothetical protein
VRHASVARVAPNRETRQRQFLHLLGGEPLEVTVTQRSTLEARNRSTTLRHSHREFTEQRPTSYLDKAGGTRSELPRKNRLNSL